MLSFSLFFSDVIDCGDCCCCSDEFCGWLWCCCWICDESERDTHCEDQCPCCFCWWSAASDPPANGNGTPVVTESVVQTEAKDHGAGSAVTAGTKDQSEKARMFTAKRVMSNTLGFGSKEDPSAPQTCAEVVDDENPD
eukprot:jgi/Bigna1/134229/aug1.24_g8937